MEIMKNEQIYAFDSLYTTNHIQMLKILLPCLNPPLQKNLALYIKFLELRYTISFLSAHPYVINGCGFDREHRAQDIPIDALLPYLTPQEAENFRQLQKSMDMMKQFSNMQKNMEALKGILPEGMDLDTLFQSMMNGAGGGFAEYAGDSSRDVSAADNTDAQGTKATDASSIENTDASGTKYTNASGTEKTDASHTESTDAFGNRHLSETPKNTPFSSGTNGLLQKMMQGAPSGDVLKNMMSDSQKELYEKFNERFQNL